MRFSVSFKVIILNIIVAVMAFGTVFQGEAFADVEFRWAVLADKGNGMEGLDFSNDPPVVYSGTPLQIYLEHLENCHVYLYLLDSSNQLTPLYPPEKGFYDYGFPRGPKYIPPGNQSFTFVPPVGVESLFLIGSEERLFQIERLTQEFLENSNSIAQQKLLLRELVAIIEQRQKESVSAEDIESVQRKIRTDKGVETTSFKAVEVDISESYGRKLLIDHQ